MKTLQDLREHFKTFREVSHHVELEEAFSAAFVNQWLRLFTVHPEGSVILPDTHLCENVYDGRGDGWKTLCGYWNSSFNSISTVTALSGVPISPNSSTADSASCPACLEALHTRRKHGK